VPECRDRSDGVGVMKVETHTGELTKDRTKKERNVRILLQVSSSLL